MENSGVNSLQREIKSLNAKIEEYKVKISQTTYYYDEIRTKYEELKIKTDMIMDKPVTAESSSQTEPMTGATFVEQMDWDRVNKRAENYKTQYFKLLDEYKNKEAQYKQNVAKLSELNRRMDGLQWKYNQTKEICNNRLTLLNENQVKITECEQNEARLKAELDALKQTLQQTPENSVAYNQFKSQYNELKEQHSKAIQKCQEAANTLGNLKEKYAEIKAENESLKQQLADTKAELNALNEECVALRQSNSAQEGELNTLSELADRLKRYNAAYRLVKAKYERAKELCEGRFHRIQYLQRELRKHDIEFEEFYETGIENIPNNS